MWLSVYHSLCVGWRPVLSTCSYTYVATTYLIITDLMVNATLQYLEEAASSSSSMQPFYLFLSFTTPHAGGVGTVSITSYTSAEHFNALHLAGRWDWCPCPIWSTKIQPEQMAKGRSSFANSNVKFDQQVERDFGSVVTIQDQHVVCVCQTTSLLRISCL